jgi:Fur family transcriptional regulator, ferric uptake regulator
MKLTANRIAGTLRQHGYKLTPQRHAVLKAIAASHHHQTPATIYQQAQAQNPRVSLVTVYRTLDILTELKLVCEVHSAGNSKNYLMRRPEEHHHHLVCSGCGRVVDFSNCDLGELEASLSHRTGFMIETHYLEFQGRCPECRPNGANYTTMRSKG